MSDVPNSTSKIQIESMQTNNPDSEGMLQAVGGAVNYCLSNKPAVGDIVTSCLDESTFQGQRDTTWVLCDGRSVVGTAYQSLTGQTNIPDLRGRFPRGKDNGSGNDTHGDLAIGTYEADQVGPHSHTLPALTGPTVPYGSVGPNNEVITGAGSPVNTRTIISASQSTNASTGNETNPRSIVVNFFVKIDY